jgi:hypothetical protein
MNLTAVQARTVLAASACGCHRTGMDILTSASIIITIIIIIIITVIRLP